MLATKFMGSKDFSRGGICNSYKVRSTGQSTPAFIGMFRGMQDICLSHPFFTMSGLELLQCKHALAHICHPSREVHSQIYAHVSDYEVTSDTASTSIA